MSEDDRINSKHYNEIVSDLRAEQHAFEGRALKLTDQVLLVMAAIVLVFAVVVACTLFVASL